MNFCHPPHTSPIPPFPADIILVYFSAEENLSFEQSWNIGIKTFNLL